MNEMRILFTGVGRRIELLQAFRNAALVLNKKLIIYGADMVTTAPACAYCDYTRIVVAMKNDHYIDNLLEICNKDSIDLIIPTIDTDLLILSRNKKAFESIGTKVMISEPDKILICRDKNNTSQFFVDCGLCAPMPVNNWREYRGGFPAFIKPKDGSSSIDAFKIQNQKELEIMASQVKDYIVQPFINGTEYTIDVVCDWDGNPISIIPRERIQVRAGEVLKTRICMDDVMIAEVRKLCEKFKPCGPMTVQLIREQHSGEDYYIEINPRFGGGAPLSMKAGARTAEIILKMMSEEQVDEWDNIADGAVYSRFDQSVCVEEGRNKVSGVIFDLDDTLYSEKDYVRSGFIAVADYLGNPEYAEVLWAYFENGEPAIDKLLADIDKINEKEKVLHVYRFHKPSITLDKDICALLIRLRREGIKVGIVTDGRPEGQRNKLEVLGLYKLVDDVVITDELGGVQFRKPCDIAFRILQTKWRLPASEIVYIGDNYIKDSQAPRQLGMKFVWLRNEDSLYFKFDENHVANQNYIDTITELYTFLFDCKER